MIWLDQGWTKATKKLLGSVEENTGTCRLPGKYQDGCRQTKSEKLFDVLGSAPRLHKSWSTHNFPNAEERTNLQQAVFFRFNTTTMSADPSGWVKNPPSVVCKIEGTSRESMNGNFALIVQWNGERYTALLTKTSQQVALRPANLKKAGYIDTAKAYYELAMNNPELQAQWARMQQQIETTTGYPPRTVGMALLAVLIVGSYLVGFTRMWILMLVLGVGAYVTQGGQTTSPSAVWYRWKGLLASQVPSFVGRYRYGMELATFLLLSFLAFTFVMAGASGTSVVKGRGNGITESDADYYYKLGFDDSTAGRNFGHSLVEAPPGEEPAPKTSWDVSLGSTTKQSPWTISTAMSLFLIGRTVYGLGQNGGGWSWQLALANLQHLDMMRAGFLALAVYRVVSAFLM